MISSAGWISLGAILGAAGVALGAYGAHGLEGHLAGQGYAAGDLARRLANYETAVRYQMWHAAALVLVGILVGTRPGPWWQASGAAFFVGIVLFSGLLYVLALAGPALRWLGAVVPLGGLSLIAGWLLLAIAAWRSPIEG